jgi:hypothetical protein
MTRAKKSEIEKSADKSTLRHHAGGAALRKGKTTGPGVIQSGAKKLSGGRPPDIVLEKRIEDEDEDDTENEIFRSRKPRCL